MASTVIRFRILPPLYALNRAMIVVPTRGGAVKFNFKITPSGQSPWTGHGNVTVLGDDIGAMHNTIVEAEFPAIVSSDEAQGAAVRLLNVILGYYRSAAKVPQIRSIALIHAGGVQFVQTPDTGEPVRGSHFKGLSLRPDGADAGVGDGDVDVIKEVQEGVRRGPVAVWVSGISLPGRPGRSQRG